MDFNAAVLGHPVTHSLSPVIHNAIYRYKNINWEYGKIDAPTATDATSVFNRCKSTAMLARTPEEAFIGLNVTTPYKNLAQQLCDRANVSSEIVGGANTISFVEECNEITCTMVASCDSTDGEGACRALERLGNPINGANILIMGTGATALSILFSALVRGVEKVYVASRNVEDATKKVSQLIDRANVAKQEDRLISWGFADDIYQISGDFSMEKIDVVSYDVIEKVLQACSIVVNATPIGMKDSDASLLPDGALNKGQFVLDAVYGCGLTKICRQAEEAGAKYSDGLPMLIEQAILSAGIWLANSGIYLESKDEKLYRVLEQAGISYFGYSCVAEVDFTQTIGDA